MIRLTGAFPNLSEEGVGKCYANQVLIGFARRVIRIAPNVGPFIRPLNQDLRSKALFQKLELLKSLYRKRKMEQVEGFWSCNGISKTDIFFSWQKSAVQDKLA
jgi:hypothetical protein